MARPRKRTRVTAKKSAPGKLTIRPITYRKGDSDYSAFLVQGWKEDGKWQRRQFATEADAKQFVATKTVELLNDVKLHTVSTKLTGDQVEEAEAAFRRLGGRYTLMEAVEFFVANFAEPETPMPIFDAIRAFGLGKEAEGVRARSLRQLDSTLGQFRTFAESRGVIHVHEVTRLEVERFLKGLRARNGVDRASRKTWNNYRADLSSFFNWCADPSRRWIRSNPTEGIIKYKAAGGVPETLTIRQVLRLLREVEQFKDGKLSRYFALALFSGLRTGPEGELHKLASHPDRDRLIDLRRGVIHVPPEVSKTSQKRQIVIRENLRRWLENSPEEILSPNHDREIKMIRKAHGLTHDVLRHTFISYHVAAFRSVGDAALEAGNSEAVTKKHYLNLATRTEGLAFWRIAPKGHRIPKQTDPEYPLKIVA